MAKMVKTEPLACTDKQVVTMSNALTRAGHGLSLPEKRVVFIAISKIDSRKPLPLNEFGIYTSRITAAEYAELAQCEIQTAYQALKEASKALYSRTITFFEPAHKRKGGLVKVHMRWVGEVKYYDNEGWAELLWWPQVLPHLTGLQRHFSSYQLRQTSGLRSIYAWKMLELLSRFQSTGWAEYTIEDFAAAMEATEKQQSDFGKLRTKIIEPAIKELTEKDGWIIEWKPIKAGRKVKAVRFDFQRTLQEPLPLENGDMPRKARYISKAEIERHAHPGETYEQVKARLQASRT